MEQWSDRINPIIVKEMRQTVRSGVLLSALLSVAGLIMLALFLQMGTRNLALSPDQPIGRNIFELLVNLLFFFCLIIIPANAAVRLIQERDLSNVDLFYASMLSPGAIVRGKLACGGYQIFLFFMICAPFLFVTNLLRGIDLFSIVIVLIVGWALVMAEVLIAIFVGSMNVRKTVRAIIGGLGLAVTLPILTMIFGLCTSVATREGGWGLLVRIFSGGGFVALLIAGPIIGVLYAISVGLVGGNYGHRGIRIYEADVESNAREV